MKDLLDKWGRGATRWRMVATSLRDALTYDTLTCDTITHILHTCDVLIRIARSLATPITSAPNTGISTGGSSSGSMVVNESLVALEDGGIEVEQLEIQEAVSNGHARKDIESARANSEDQGSGAMLDLGGGIGLNEHTEALDGLMTGEPLVVIGQERLNDFPGTPRVEEARSIGAKRAVVTGASEREAHFTLRLLI